MSGVHGVSKGRVLPDCPAGQPKVCLASDGGRCGPTQLRSHVTTSRRRHCPRPTTSTSHHTMSSDIAAFHAVFNRAKRILAICGAGLSASSGLPTFRGAGGLWRNYEATSLATPQAFARDPGLVWLFYGYRRHMALRVKPNDGHRSLAALASKQPGFLCLTQNVDSELRERSCRPLIP